MSAGAAGGGAVSLAAGRATGGSNIVVVKQKIPIKVTGTGVAQGARSAGRRAAAVDGYWPPQMLPLTPTPSESPMPQRRPSTGFRPDSADSQRNRPASRGLDLRNGQVGRGVSTSGGGGGGRSGRLGAPAGAGLRDSPPPTLAVDRNGTGLVARKEAATMMQRWVRRNSGSLSPQREGRGGGGASTREATMREEAQREAAMLRGSVAMTMVTLVRFEARGEA